MTLSTAIKEYNDTEFLRYLQEEIENKGRQGELMEMMTCHEIQYTSLQMALIYQKSKEAIFKMMDIGGIELIMMNDQYDETALHCACETENISIEIISKMLEMGGRELLMMNGQYGTALHCACKHRNENISMEIISKMLEMGGRELLMRNEYGYTALHALCMSK